MLPFIFPLCGISINVPVGTEARMSWQHYASCLSGNLLGDPFIGDFMEDKE